MRVCVDLAVRNVAHTCSETLLFIAAALFLFSGYAFASGRSKTDIVYMKNGDKSTYEIKSLEKGQLTVKPDYSSSNVSLDWTKVDHIESTQGFVISDLERSTAGRSSMMLNKGAHDYRRRDYAAAKREGCGNTRTG